MPKLPSITIVIPAYNEEDVIAKCLESCINQTSPADEILIVDNNSKDATASIVQSYQKDYPDKNIRLVTEKTQGLIPARNHGFDRAKSDVIGRIDADSIIEPSWVEVVRRVFQDDSIAGATGPVLYHDMPLQKVGFQVDEKIRNTLHKLAKDHSFLFGSNMAIRASAWRQIKAFTSLDPDDQLHEDIDLALTLFEHHQKIIYDPNMIAGMSARRVEDSPRDFYRYIMRFERTYKLHNVKSATARMPMLIYLLIYFPVRTIRKFYDAETNQFTLQKLRDELSRMRS